MTTKFEIDGVEVRFGKSRHQQRMEFFASHARPERREEGEYDPIAWLPKEITVNREDLTWLVRYAQHGPPSGDEIIDRRIDIRHWYARLDDAWKSCQAALDQQKSQVAGDHAAEVAAGT